MRVLLDTCVISELWRKGSSEIVRERISGLAPQDTYLSVLTIGEINKGIQLLKESKKKRELQNKLTFLENEYRHNILEINIETMLVWGEITAVCQKKGKPVPLSNGLIAATAIAHGLHLMTCNTGDFQYMGSLLINPWR